MPDIDLGELFQEMQRDTRQPAFAEIRARQVRRTHRVFRTTAALVAVVLAAGVVGYLRAPRASAPVAASHPAPSPTPSASTFTAPPISRIATESVGFTSAGSMYVLVDTCPAQCDGASGYVGDVYRSVDLGAHWQLMSRLASLSGAEGLLVGSDRNLWIQDGVVTYGSTDSGRTWAATKWVAPTFDSTGSGGPADSRPIGYAGGVAWFSIGRHVELARPSLGVSKTSDPPGISKVTSFVALDAEHAILGGVSSGKPVWFVTPDQGQKWLPEPSPCADQLAAGTLARALDGTVWAVCQNSAGSSALLRTSTDRGASWVARSQVTTPGDLVFPASGTVAWLTGGHADVERTTDGKRWTVVLPSAASGGLVAFAAYSGSVAAAAYGTGHGGPTIYLTTDGGAHWAARPVG